MRVFTSRLDRLGRGCACLPPSLESLSARSFPPIPQCAGVHWSTVEHFLDRSRGVSQGGLLSTTLFRIYVINDITNNIIPRHVGCFQHPACW